MVARASPRVEWREPKAMNLLWTFVAGPMLALLPEEWRHARVWDERVRWEAAGTVSGILEMLGSITALGYWYMHEMMKWINDITGLADSGRLAQGLDDHQVRGAALMLLYMSPMTWILFYFFVEGAVRLCAAAFTGNVYGTLPLGIMERALFAVRKPEEARVRETLQENAKSIAESVRERVMVARLEDVGDKVRFQKEGEDEVLEIWACRRKEDWDPPKTVKVDEAFYRLEEGRVGAGARPYQYRLRKVEAGVMGRTVLTYRTR